jgi:hypothetical protein
MQTAGSDGRVAGWTPGEGLKTPHEEIRVVRKLQNFTQGFGPGSCECGNESSNAIKEVRITFYCRARHVRT